LHTKSKRDWSSDVCSSDLIFDTIIKIIPAPVDNSDEPLQFQITILDWDDYVGRIGVGRISRSKVKVSDNITVMKSDGSTQNFRRSEERRVGTELKRHRRQS